MERHIRVYRRVAKTLFARAPHLTCLAILYGVLCWLGFILWEDLEVGAEIFENLWFSLTSALFASTATLLTRPELSGWRRIPAAAVAWIGYGIVVALGLIVLIAPGVFLFVRMGLTLQYIIDGRTIRDAFSESWKTTEPIGNDMVLSAFFVMFVGVVTWIPVVWLISILVMLVAPTEGYELGLGIGIIFDFVVMFLVFTVWASAWFDEVHLKMDVAEVFE